MDEEIRKFLTAYPRICPNIISPISIILEKNGWTRPECASIGRGHRQTWPNHPIMIPSWIYLVWLLRSSHSIKRPWPCRQAWLPMSVCLPTIRPASNLTRWSKGLPRTSWARSPFMSFELYMKPSERSFRPFWINQRGVRIFEDRTADKNKA